MKRVLVTGATGFVGSHCIPVLAGEGYEVHAVSSKRRANASGDRVSWHQCDLMNDGEVESLFAAVRPTHLLHMAWYAVPQRFWNAVENVDWLRTTLAIVRSFAAHGGTRVVAAGSCAEYDWSSGGVCREASTRTQPATLYGACKLAAYLATDAYCRQIGISSAWGRIFFMYGPGEDRQRFVASIITSLMEGLPARCSDGSQVRDMLHVQDVARAFVALLGSDVRSAVNIGSGMSPRLADVARAIAAKMGRPDLLQLGALAPRPNDPPSIVAETRRLNEEVHWSPGMSLDAGLEQAIAWWQSRPKQQSNRETDEAHH